jgi:hypothetical protein
MREKYSFYRLFLIPLIILLILSNLFFAYATYLNYGFLNFYVLRIFIILTAMVAFGSVCVANCIAIFSLKKNIHRFILILITSILIFIFIFILIAR